MEGQAMNLRNLGPHTNILLSIPTRRELVKEAARDPSTTQVKEVQNEQQQYHWTSCPISHQPLISPVVSDSFGVLYNKAAVLESLIEASKSTEGALNTINNGEIEFRIRSLRDVVEVIFQAEGEDEPRKPGMRSTSKWVCPVTKKMLGPGVKAVYLVPCGHAFLESVIKEMPGESCLQVGQSVLWLNPINSFQCNESYTPDNVIPILPVSAAEKERLKRRVSRLKQDGLTHSLKKAIIGGKKRKKNPKISETKYPEQNLDAKRTQIGSAERDVSAIQKNIRNEETASLTAKVLAEEQDRNKRRKHGVNENLKSLFSTNDDTNDRRTDFMTRGFSIPAGAKR